MAKIQMGISSISIDHKPSPAEYQNIYNSFSNELIEPEELAFVVAAGQSFGHWAGKPRIVSNWQSAQFVGVDLEKHPDAALPIATENPFYKLYGQMAYTTISHKPDEPRSRLVFILDKPIDDVEVWHWGARAIAEMFGAASDLAAADRGRSFLGNPNANIIVNNRLLPSTTFKMLSRQRERMNQERIKAAERRYSSSTSEPSLMGEPQEILLKWAERVRGASHGERNSKLNRAAFMAGRYLVRRGLPEGEAYSVLVAAGVSAGLDESEAVKTVSSAIKRGIGG